MIVELPIRNDFRHFNFTIDLDGTIYRLQFDYNFRMDRWMMSILDAEGVRLLGNVPVQPGWDNTSRYPQEALPDGVFIPVNEATEHAPATEESFSTDVKILYLDSEERAG